MLTMDDTTTHSFRIFHSPRSKVWRRSSIIEMSTVQVSPGAPLVNKIDAENNIAYMSVAISGEHTQRAFNKACDLFNEVI